MIIRQVKKKRVGSMKPADFSAPPVEIALSGARTRRRIVLGGLFGGFLGNPRGCMGMLTGFHVSLHMLTFMRGINAR